MTRKTLRTRSINDGRTLRSFLAEAFGVEEFGPVESTCTIEEAVANTIAQLDAIELDIKPCRSRLGKR